MKIDQFLLDYIEYINGIVCQINFIAILHLRIYMKPDLLEWFVSEFPKHSDKKLDVKKSCIRFKKVNTIPLELIAELVKKMSINLWIETYKSKL